MKIAPLIFALVVIVNVGLMNSLKRGFVKPESNKLELKYSNKNSGSVSNVTLATCGADRCAKVTEFSIADNNTFECREERVGILFNMPGQEESFHGYVGRNDAFIHGVQTYGACTTFRRLVWYCFTYKFHCTANPSNVVFD